MSELGSRDAPDLREWGSPRPVRFGAFEWLWLFVVLGVPALVLVLIGLLLAGLAAAGVVLPVYVVVAVWWLDRAGRAVIAAQEDARTVTEHEAPRLTNLVDGISADLGIAAPRVLLTPGPPNALVCRARTPVLLVRRSLVEDFTRTELEAVVAHCLIRVAAGELRRASLAAALGPLAGPAGVSNVEDIDARTVALTRYPPALAAALEKTAPERGPFWFVASGAAPSAEERARRLRDL